MQVAVVPWPPPSKHQSVGLGPVASRVPRCLLLALEVVRVVKNPEQRLPLAGTAATPRTQLLKQDQQSLGPPPELAQVLAGLVALGLVDRLAGMARPQAPRPLLRWVVVHQVEQTGRSKPEAGQRRHRVAMVGPMRPSLAAVAAPRSILGAAVGSPARKRRRPLVAGAEQSVSTVFAQTGSIAELESVKPPIVLVVRPPLPVEQLPEELMLERCSSC